MNATRRFGCAAAGCVVLAMIGSGCLGEKSPTRPTVVHSKIEWTQNGVQKSYSDVGSQLDLTTNRWMLDVTVDGIEIIDFATPYGVGKWMIADSAEMAMGQSGCDEYVAGNGRGSGWIEITKLQVYGGFPVVVEGRFEVTLVADGYCSSSGPTRVCSGTFVSSGYD